MNAMNAAGRRPLFGMLLAMTIFGTVGYAAGFTGLSSYELVFVRCLCGTLFLAAGWLLSGQAARERWNRKEVLLVLASGLLLVFNWVFLFRAFELMPVTVAISIYYFAPVIVLLAGSALFRERLTWHAIVSIALCALGTALVSGIRLDTPLSDWAGGGVLWAFLAALFYAALTLLGKGIRDMSPYAVSMLQTALGVAILPPFVQFGAYEGLSASNWTAAAIVGVVHTGLVYFLFFGSVRHLSARAISALVFLDPGVAILADMALSGFRPTWPQAAGIALTFGGMAVMLFRREEPKINVYGETAVAAAARRVTFRRSGLVCVHNPKIGNAAFSENEIQEE
ncbi:threonine/homoserine efflux transporter RhtA [Paenibacillus methanolicus]|uniref:Threonine/homoserine efflux transporter RhtA n=2 Tax=Paenibacillus methanolicus TaxID=582686 RepID=A0A5S5CA78_9BACL|nr:DMT family transporter [Paenibacillus methanolicus]TYP74893.1 threonine/homoserine efflux transporter RhtA [Paenibacillus methanolicus]